MRAIKSPVQEVVEANPPVGSTDLPVFFVLRKLKTVIPPVGYMLQGGEMILRAIENGFSEKPEYIARIGTDYEEFKEWLKKSYK